MAQEGQSLAVAAKYSDDIADAAQVAYAVGTNQDAGSSISVMRITCSEQLADVELPNSPLTKAGINPKGSPDVELPNLSRQSSNLDLPKAGTVADSAASVAGGAKVRDLDVPKVRDVQTPDASDNARLGRTRASSSELIPGTPEHKAQRWKEYQARENAGWSYERWSKQYDTNMQNASYGLSREQQYREILGGQSRMLEPVFTTSYHL